MQPPPQQQLVAVRVKDGLFVGNQTSSQDDEFLFMNKVSHIVNCAGSETPNLYQQANVHYLSYHWRDLPNTVLFDAEGRNIRQIYEFIEKGLEKGECVLVHSVLGTSRCCAVVAGYLMQKYGWTLDNTVAFMRTAHPDMDIKPYFLRQLGVLARKLEPDYDIFHPELDTDSFCLDNEQWMLRNTYINSLGFDHIQNGEIRRAVIEHEERERLQASTKPPTQRKRITYSDTGQGSSVISAVTKPIIAGRAPLDPHEKIRLYPATRGILAKAPLPLIHSLQSADGRQCTVERWPLKRRGHKPVAPAATATAGSLTPQLHTSTSVGQLVHQHPSIPHSVPSTSAPQAQQPPQPQSLSQPAAAVPQPQVSQQPHHPLPTLRTIDGPSSLQALSSTGPNYSASGYAASHRYDYTSLGAGAASAAVPAAQPQSTGMPAQSQAPAPVTHDYGAPAAAGGASSAYGYGLKQPTQRTTGGSSNDAYQSYLAQLDRPANPSPVSEPAAPPNGVGAGAGAGTTPAWGAGGSQFAVNPSLLRQHNPPTAHDSVGGGFHARTATAPHHHATSGAAKTTPVDPPSIVGGEAPGPVAAAELQKPPSTYGAHKERELIEQPPASQPPMRTAGGTPDDDGAGGRGGAGMGTLRLHQPPSVTERMKLQQPGSGTNSPRGAAGGGVGPRGQAGGYYDSNGHARGGYSAGGTGGLQGAGNAPGLRGRTQGGHSPFSVHSQGPRKGSPLPQRMAEGRDRMQAAQNRYPYDHQSSAAPSNVAFGSSVGLSPRDGGLGPAVNRIQARHGVRGGTPTKQRAGSPSQRTSMTGSPQRVPVRKTYSSLHSTGGRAGTPTRDRDRPGTPTRDMHDGRASQRASRPLTRDNSLQKSHDWDDRSFGARTPRDPYNNQPDSARSLSEDQRARKGLGPKKGSSGSLAQNTSAASPLMASIKKPLRASSASDRLMQPTVSFLRKTSRN